MDNVSQRELGTKIAVSIGTALPLEEKVTTDIPPTKNIWFNVSTLYRNLYDAHADPQQVNATEITDTFVEEVAIIHGLLSDTMNPVFYTTDSSLLEKRFKHAVLKHPVTDRQKLYENREKLAIEALIKKKYPTIIRCGLVLPGEGQKAWVLTHRPLDLMSRYEFKELLLLSSYTGEIKRPHEWITKLTKNVEYRMLPFNLLTMQIIGDGAVQFKAHRYSYRKLLVEMATTYKWKPTTTREKIIFDLNKLKDKAVAELFKEMLNVKIT